MSAINLFHRGYVEKWQFFRFVVTVIFKGTERQSATLIVLVAQYTHEWLERTVFQVDFRPDSTAEPSCLAEMRLVNNLSNSA